MDMINADNPRLKKNSQKTKILDFKDIKSPEFATPAKRPPDGAQWIHEIKFDGYRTICRKDERNVQLFTKNGFDWSHKYDFLKKECEELAAKSIVLDGEIVWLDKKGHSHLQGLQKALEAKETDQLVYYVFDLLFLNGHDIRGLSLKERKRLLSDVIEDSGLEKVILSHYWDESGESIFQNACRYNWEGIVSKNSESCYLSGRNENWFVTKCEGAKSAIRQ